MQYTHARIHTISTCNIHMQCRGEWKLARASTMSNQPCVYYAVFRNACIRASFHSPLQLRDVFYAMYFIRGVFYMRCILYVYLHVDIACVFCVLTIVENYVDL